MPRKHQPPQYASCYSLDLYCDRECGSDNCGHSDYQNRAGCYTGETFTECAREARADGWKIHQPSRTATCPECVALDKRARRVLQASLGKTKS